MVTDTAKRSRKKDCELPDIDKIKQALSDQKLRTIEEIIAKTHLPAKCVDKILTDETNSGLFYSKSKIVTRIVGKNKMPERVRQYALKAPAYGEVVEALTHGHIETLLAKEEFVAVADTFAKALANANAMTYDEVKDLGQRMAYYYYIMQEHEAKAWDKDRKEKTMLEERLSYAVTNVKTSSMYGSSTTIKAAMLKRMRIKKKENSFPIEILDNIIPKREKDSWYDYVIPTGFVSTERSDFALIDGRDWRYYVFKIDEKKLLNYATNVENVWADLLNKDEYSRVIVSILENKDVIESAQDKEAAEIIDQLKKFGLLRLVQDESFAYTNKERVYFSPKIFRYCISLQREFLEMCRSKSIDGIIDRFSLDIAELEKLNVRTLQDLEAFVSTKPNQTDAKLPVFFEPGYKQFDKKQEYELYKELILKIYEKEDLEQIGARMKRVLEELRGSKEEELEKTQKKHAPVKIKLTPLKKESPKAKYVPQIRHAQPKPVPQKPKPAATLNKFSTSKMPVTMVKKSEGKVILSYADIATAVRKAEIPKDEILIYVQHLYINAGVNKASAKTRAYNFQNKLRHATLGALAKGGNYNNVKPYLTGPAPLPAEKPAKGTIEETVEPSHRVKTHKVEAKTEAETSSLDDKFDGIAEGLEILDHLPLTDAERRDVDGMVSNAYDRIGMKIKQYMTKYAKGMEEKIASDEKELQNAKSLLQLTKGYLDKK